MPLACGVCKDAALRPDKESVFMLVQPQACWEHQVCRKTRTHAPALLIRLCCRRIGPGHAGMKQDLPEYGWRQMAARNRNPIRMASHVVGLSVPALKNLSTDVRAMLHFSDH